MGSQEKIHLRERDGKRDRDMVRQRVGEAENMQAYDKRRTKTWLLYDADTEVDDGPDVDLVVDLDQDQQNYDSGEWQKNTNGFPKLPRFSAQPGIKVALSDDPSPLELYILFITDELINSWKVETNRYARAIINSKNCGHLSPCGRCGTS
ncbi:hypothetical protein PoB_001236100 [Plakobranchus ocellatus]|uniref:Uncharacterized protein n=1 Tax=Plakobranchus ocellatus TaxID=259542 RepID=A0AAV3YU13_9GAST|nr:hypothetical protein PoB_001236100 [Plakobranchus ocellatus]